MPGYGTLGHLGINRQSTLTGSGVGTQDFVPIVSESIAAARETIKAEEIRGVVFEGAFYQGKESVAGQVVMEAHPVGIGYFMRSIFGQASATVTAGLATTTFEPRNADFADNTALPPYEIEVHRDMTSSFVYYGMVCNEFELQFTGGALTRATASLIGRTWDIIGKNSPSFPTREVFAWNQSSFSIAGVSSISGIITDLTVRCTANVEMRYYHDLTRRPAGIARSGRWTCVMNGTLDYISAVAQDQWDYWNNFTANSFGINAVSNTGSSSLRISVPSFRFTEFAPQIGGPNTISVNFAGEAEYNTTAAKLLQMILVSAVQSGYDNQ